MKLKQTFLCWLGIAMFLLLPDNVYAQVTMGSTDKPKDGALLDLNEGITNQGDANSNRGLMLPRVRLVELNKLTMGTNALPNNEYLQHTGLTVYNKTTETDAHCAHIPNGIYVWDGAKWGELIPNPTLASDVLEDKDQDGNIFLYRKFGNAGYWMLQNLRATKFDPLRNYVNGSIPQKLVGSTYAPNKGAPQWAYPAEAGNTDATISNLYDNNRTIGLLYNWAAATNSRGGYDGTDVTENEAGLQYNGRYVREQGICPFGWYLPSDNEWTDLANEIIAHPTIYSSLTSITGGALSSGVGDTNGGARGSTHGKAMRSHCIAPSATSTYYGASLPLRQSGFSAMVVGHVLNDSKASGYGSLTNFWTSSARNASMAWDRTLEVTANNETRNPSNYEYMFSVRCKKVDCVTWDDKSTTDLTAKTVTDHEGNSYPIGNFGNAGWWMTENMRAKSMPDECYGPVAIKYIPGITSFADPYYLYPNDISCTGNVPTSYTQQQGLLYNWAALTYGKGGADGMGNVDQKANNEGDYDESNLDSQRIRRGICPKGWHVPSDYEWNELEQAVVSGWSSYSTGASAPEAWQVDWSYRTDGAGLTRGTHGAIIKSTTPLNGIATGGKSRVATQNGFNALLVGYGYLKNTNVGTNGEIEAEKYGKLSGFWTSSSAPTSKWGKGSSSWNRYVYDASDTSAVRRVISHRGLMLSVRCKKD